MSDNKHAGRGGKGYYIALILCAAAIGITSYVYYRNANRVEEVSIQESVGEDILVGTMEAEDVPALATQPQTQSTPPRDAGSNPRSHHEEAVQDHVSGFRRGDLRLLHGSAELQ